MRNHQEVLDVLGEKVLPDLIRGASTELPVRAWVPACSTGEEAYWLAICFLEQFRATHREPHLRIFATDVDESALAIARRGVYGESIAGLLSAAWLERYFERTPRQRYRINEQLRSTVLIGRQDLFRDPPIVVKLDLISYRTIPADLESNVLRRLSIRFHFALKKDGWLLLGGAGAIVPPAELFEPVADGAEQRRTRFDGHLAALVVDIECQLHIAGEDRIQRIRRWIGHRLSNGVDAIDHHIGRHRGHAHALEHASPAEGA